MSKRITTSPFFILFILTLSACNLPLVESQEISDLALTITAQALIIEQGAQSPTATLTPIVIVITATPAESNSTATPQTIASETPSQTSASAPTSTLSSTGAPTVTVSVATNCRTGPGQAYASIFGLPVGQSAEVVGKNTSTNYWIIKIPNGAGTCWLWGQYATVTGDTSALPTVAIPPTPTPTITPTPKVTVTPTSTTALAPAAPSNASAVLLTCVSKNFIQTFTATFTWTDNSNNETGFNIYVNANYPDGSGKDLLNVSVGPNTTSYTITATALSKLPPVIKVEAFNNTGSSTRVSASPLALSSCP